MDEIVGHSRYHSSAIQRRHTFPRRDLGRSPSRITFSVLLFLVYINDILFMDDCVIFASADSKKHLYSRLQARSNILAGWPEVNCVLFNVKKGKVLPHCATGKPRLLLHDHPIPVKNHVTYLDVKFNVVQGWALPIISKISGTWSDKEAPIQLPENSTLQALLANSANAILRMDPGKDPFL